MSSEDATPRTEAAQKEGRKRRLIVCLDSGDTLVDEGTEVKENKTVMHADPIPGVPCMTKGTCSYSWQMGEGDPSVTYYTRSTIYGNTSLASLSPMTLETVSRTARCSRRPWRRVG